SKRDWSSDVCSSDLIFHCIFHYFFYIMTCIYNNYSKFNRFLSLMECYISSNYYISFLFMCFCNKFLATTSKNCYFFYLFFNFYTYTVFFHFYLLFFFYNYFFFLFLFNKLYYPHHLVEFIIFYPVFYYLLFLLFFSFQISL